MILKLLIHIMYYLILCTCIIQKTDKDEDDIKEHGKGQWHGQPRGRKFEDTKGAIRIRISKKTTQWTKDKVLKV